MSTGDAALAIALALSVWVVLDKIRAARRRRSLRRAVLRGMRAAASLTVHYRHHDLPAPADPADPYGPPLSAPSFEMVDDHAERVGEVRDLDLQDPHGAGLCARVPLDGHGLKVTRGGIDGRRAGEADLGADVDKVRAHKTSPSVGQDPVGTRPVVGAPGAVTPGAGDPTVGEPTDTAAVPSAAAPVSVERPVGGDAAPASPSTAADNSRRSSSQAGVASFRGDVL
ncbi:hypothetical protein [Cellulomonas sp. HZM]|uniref:hypothetical protein n=1 Tax=Cellulomonas sp. HZM TaxID=1454010 RepID=UPI0012DFA833|nr:hypothetical protein [Cellulomonas sp. HZM]